MTRRLWLAAGVLTLWLHPASAYNESFCAPLDKAIDRLGDNGEVLIAWYVDGEIVKGFFGDAELLGAPRP